MTATSTIEPGTSIATVVDAPPTGGGMPWSRPGGPGADR
jgi:hypothetical protein